MQNNLLDRARFATSSSNLALLNLWKNVVAEISFNCGQKSFEIETVDKGPVVDDPSEWISIEGKSPLGRFDVILPSDFCLDLFEGFCPDIQVDQLDGTKGAILLEHFFGQGLEALEALFGTELQLVAIADLHQIQGGELYGFDITDREQTWTGGLSVSGELTDRLEEVAKRYANEAERMLDPKMIVHLGAVALPSRHAFMIAENASIDCGVQPEDVIHGYLLRSDNYYWPIYIEDQMVQIAGDLQGPIDPSRIADEQVFATFGIGEVEISAARRSSLTIGSTIEINRYTNNAVDIYFQGLPYGSGSLIMMDANLGVTVTSLGNATNHLNFVDQQKPGVA